MTLIEIGFLVILLVDDFHVPYRREIKKMFMQVFCERLGTYKYLSLFVCFPTKIRMQSPPHNET